MSDEKASSPRSSKLGLVIILTLGVIFVALLAGLIAAGSRRAPRIEARSRSYYVIAPKLRVRTEPQARAPVLTTADREAKVEIIEEAGVWAKVKTADGIVGWAERSHIAGQKEYERRMTRARAISKLPALEGFVTERTAVYAGPGFFYPVVGQLALGMKTQVYTRDHEFYAIDYSGTIGYAEVDAVELAPQAQEQLEVAAETTTAAATTTMQIAEATPTEPVQAPDTAPMSGWTPQTAQPDPIGVYPAVPPGGTQPQVVSRVNPIYPRLARDNGAEGVVVIRAIVRRDGRVDEVEVLRDLPWGLGEAARESVRQWRFLPATYRGDPIDVYYTVTVRFRLRE